MDPTENTLSHCCGCMFTALLLGDRLPTVPPARHGPHRKHSVSSIVACIRVYRAVAWQRVDHIRCTALYITCIFYLLIAKTFLVMD
jgi:hypothetical protein